jgi:flagellar protein FliL
MGEEEKKEGAAAEQKPEKKSFLSKKNIIILGGLFVVLIVVAVVIVFKVIKPAVKDEAADKAANLEALEKKEEAIIIDMPDDFVVNIAGTGASRYLRVKIALEVENEPTKLEIEKRTSQIKDLLITTLSSKQIEQLDNADKRSEVKMEIINKFNDMLKAGKVTNIFFTDYVIQ